MKPDAADDVRAKKNALRTRAVAARGIQRARDDAVAGVRARLRTLPELATARIVMGYAATASELSVDGVLDDLHRAGTTVCLPWVDGTALRVSVVDALDGLATGWRGVREPPPESRRPLRPTQLDAVLVPGVAFDRDGNRLGHGGGHFDRFIAQLRRGAVTIGICFDAQLLDTLPTEAHDRPVDVVVTPTRTLRPARQRPP